MRTTLWYNVGLLSVWRNASLRFDGTNEKRKYIDQFADDSDSVI